MKVCKQNYFDQFVWSKDVIAEESKFIAVKCDVSFDLLCSKHDSGD